MGLGETAGCRDHHTIITCEDNQLVSEECHPALGCGYNSWFLFAQCGGSSDLPDCNGVFADL